VAGLMIVGYLAASWLDLVDGTILSLMSSQSIVLHGLLAAVLLLPLGIAGVAVRRWLGLRRALRQREAAEARLAEAARLEGVLLAARTMQHEMNNQLGMAVGYAELLADDPSLSTEQREMARTALHGAERAAALLGRLRTLTHVRVRHVGGPDGPVLALSTEAC
jgi:signal transduction histidine kinase